MTLAEARTALKRTVQASIEPILTDVEIDEILVGALRYSDYAVLTAYGVGSRVRLTGANANGRIYRCVVAGTTAATTSTWPDGISSVIGSRISDGTVIWEDDGADSIGAYDMSAAEHDSWMLKAAKVASNTDFSADGQSIKASQEAAEYRKRANLRTGAWVL